MESTKIFQSQKKKNHEIEKKISKSRKKFRNREKKFRIEKNILESKKMLLEDLRKNLKFNDFEFDEPASQHLLV